MTAAIVQGKKIDDLANYVVARGREWQFYASRTRSHLTAAKFAIPLGRQRNGTMLSDHVDCGSLYQLQRAP